MRVKVADELLSIGELNETFLAGGWGRGWPGPSNTGYQNAPGYPGALTPHDGSPILSNTAYRFVDFEGLEAGSTSVPVHNTSFYGCRIKDSSVGGALVKLYGDGPLSFDYCSLEPAADFVAGVPCPYEQSYQYGLAFGGSYGTFAGELTVTNCDIWGFGNAIDGAGSRLNAPHIFRHNWIHDAADDGGPDAPAGQYHTDGIGNTSGVPGGFEAGILIEHNTIETLGNTNGIALQGPTAYSDITIRQNLLGGFGFTVAVWADPANGGAPRTIFTDNVFSTRLRALYGPLYPQPFWTSEGSVWRRNRWHVPAGAYWGDPANDGKFWIPNTSSDPDITGDAPYVSDTDYEG